MATSPAAPRPSAPNAVFRELRGAMSQGEFAAAVRRAAREIDEHVCCDARYIGRVEAGEIRCPNYAYERVFLHMFPGRTLTDLGFEPRGIVRRRTPSAAVASHGTDITEEGDVLRRAFMTGGPAAVASLTALGAQQPAFAAGQQRPGTAHAEAVRQKVAEIRGLDDQYGADALYRPAGQALRAAWDLLDAGAPRQSVSGELHAAAGALAISVGWLAHDSGRLADARSHYAEALATARVSGDAALEAHAFCNAAFLARDAGRPREAVRAAQAGQQAARGLGSERLLALLALREAGGWAGLGDRGGTEAALARAHRQFARGPAAADPGWLGFFNEAEFASLEARCWAALGDFPRAAGSCRHAVRAALREPHYARNIALYSAEAADFLAVSGQPEEAARYGHRSLDLLERVRSSRISGMLDRTAGRLTPARGDETVATFLARRRPARDRNQV